MKRNIALLILTTLISLCCNGQSVKESFDYGWTFSHEEDGEGIHVDLPHDWDIYNQPKADAPMGNDGGYYPGGVGWYRKEFKVQGVLSAHAYQWCLCASRRRCVGSYGR